MNHFIPVERTQGGLQRLTEMSTFNPNRLSCVFYTSNLAGPCRSARRLLERFVLEFPNVSLVHALVQGSASNSFVSLPSVPYCKFVRHSEVIFSTPLVFQHKDEDFREMCDAGMMRILEILGGSSTADEDNILFSFDQLELMGQLISFGWHDWFVRRAILDKGCRSVEDVEDLKRIIKRDGWRDEFQDIFTTGDVSDPPQFQPDVATEDAIPEDSVPENAMPIEQEFEELGEQIPIETGVPAPVEDPEDEGEICASGMRMEQEIQESEFSEDMDHIAEVKVKEKTDPIVQLEIILPSGISETMEFEADEIVRSLVARIHSTSEIGRFFKMYVDGEEIPMSKFGKTLGELGLDGKTLFVAKN
eukprot:TRINITY_DN15365_c0_g1_i2.p1 TRINITY_DN15365_c0_g1~~TRINITY_DN15365_c0_g1_i2.p1  ORF type:complete len:361 (+),score=106.84 TRINITY_DN15365_c0_g1_i2:60-1142(+)